MIAANRVPLRCFELLVSAPERHDGTREGNGRKQGDVRTMKREDEGDDTCTLMFSSSADGLRKKQSCPDPRTCDSTREAEGSRWERMGFKNDASWQKGAGHRRREGQEEPMQVPETSKGGAAARQMRRCCGQCMHLDPCFWNVEGVSIEAVHVESETGRGCGERRERLGLLRGHQRSRQER